jgi:8-oxo-dGTP pyrophosphatase MutT (NUDIX family)
LLAENQMLLGMKKRGFGVGKWNGLGGKVHLQEDKEAAAVREIAEEAGLLVCREDLQRVAEIDFNFAGNPAWDNHTTVYISRTWEGEPVETEEMMPVWFDAGDMPYSQMWECDVQWIPEILAGQKLEASVYFEGENVFRSIDKRRMA